MANFICNRTLKDNIEYNILALKDFSQTAWLFISSIYKVK